jgi:hypothetical protein
MKPKTTNKQKYNLQSHRKQTKMEISIWCELMIDVVVLFVKLPCSILKVLF